MFLYGTGSGGAAWSTARRALSPAMESSWQLIPSPKNCWAGLEPASWEWLRYKTKERENKKERKYIRTHNEEGLQATFKKLVRNFLEKIIKNLPITAATRG